MFDNRPGLKAIFNSAHLNGTGAMLMSLDVGVSWALYAAAVAAGTYNKYHSLTRGEDAPKKNLVLEGLTHPAITAVTFMVAAAWNFTDATNNYFTQPGDMAKINLFYMAGWAMAFLGDNAVRRNDGENYQKNAKLYAAVKSKLKQTFNAFAPGRAVASAAPRLKQAFGALASGAGALVTPKMKKTFNALVSNPTLFYGWTSTFLVQAGLAENAMRNNVPMFSGAYGALGLATLALVGAGTLYALSRTGQAVQDKIPVDKINDGKMNGMAFTSKLAYTVLAFGEGQYGLSAGHLLYAVSSLKSLYETRAALRKAEPDAPAPPALPAPQPADLPAPPPSQQSAQSAPRPPANP